MDKAPLFERALFNIAPGWAASRSRGRREFLQHEAAVGVLRKYEAAGTGRRTDGWNRPGSSATAEVMSSAAMLRNGARQLVRDNGHAANALNVLESNVIGTGIRPGFITGGDRQARLLQELWEEHCESDKSGAEEVGNFYDRQSLGFRSIAESGSVLVRRRRRPKGVLPYSVQLLEPDYLYTWSDGNKGRNTITQGKEFDPRGDLVAIHLHLAHPGDSFIGLNSGANTVRVPIEEISHAFRMDRPGQIDGVSWLAPVMTDLRDHGDTRDAYQLRQKIAACYTAFIYESEPGGGTSNPGVPISDHIEPGRIESLPPGKEVSFASPPGVEGMTDFDRDQLRTIAAGMGIPYEALTGDLSNVNFLSGRMGWLAFYRNIDKWRQRIVIPKLCEPEMGWFLQLASLKLGINAPIRVRWTAPHRDLLDPTKEIKALREEMRLGALSYPDMVAMRGRDAGAVLDDIEKWATKISDSGLVFDWDATRVSLAGNMNPETSIEEA
jgi:lambda family phage portal protein